MKRKGTIKKGIAWLMTAVMMFSITPVMAEQVQAQAEESQAQETSTTTKTIAGLGTSVIVDPTAPANDTDAWKGSYVYYGNYDADGDGTAEPVKYRVLDASTTKFGGTTMFLDCDSILYYTLFDSDGTANEDGKKANDWSISDVKSSLNGDGFLNKEGVFTTAEKNAIAASNVEAHALTTNSATGVNVASWIQSTFVNYVALTGEQIFLLDAEDLSNGAYGYSMTKKCENHKKTGSDAPAWWLRSASNNIVGNAGFVNGVGNIASFGVYSTYTGVSPALNLNLSSVLFSSVLSGTAGETGAEYELTLLDGDMTIATSGDVTRNGKTVTVPYSISGGSSANATQVSVLVLDKEYTAGNTNGATVLDYQKLNVDSFLASGKGTYTLPDSLSEKKAGTDYHIYIVAEDVNEEKETDYASTPVEVHLGDAPTVKQMNFGTQGIIDPAVPNSESDAWKGCYVYYGNYDADGDGVAEPVKYRVLDASTTDYSADRTTQTMFLDCDSILYYQKFDSDGTANEGYEEANEWAGSDIKSSLNGDGFLNKEGVFTTAEKNAIAKSNVASHALTTDSATGVNVASWPQGAFVNYVALTGEQIFLLDAEDVSNGAYGYSMTDELTENRKKTGSSDAYWWLRSAFHNSDDGAGYVNGHGGIYSIGVSFDAPGVSPALNLNLSSVLFSSVISGTAGETGAEYKLTLLDGDMTIAVSGNVTRNGKTVTVPYSISGANSANATQVSVLVLDKEYTAGNTNGATVLDYQKLNVDSFLASGKGTYTLPDSLSEKKAGTDYHIYIVAEDVNEEKETDYASTPVEVHLVKQMNFGTQGIIDPAVPNSASDAWKGSYVYYGNYDADGDGVAEPVKYRVLDASTTDYSADRTTQTMLLDCDSILYYQRFDSDGIANEDGKKANDWSISDVKNSLNGDGFLNKAGVFTTAEKNAIAASNVEAHALTTDSATGVNVASWTQGAFVNYVALTGEQIFLLDAEDVSNGAYGYSMIECNGENRKKTGSSADYWWLRSASNDNVYAAGCVFDDGVYWGSIVYDNVKNDGRGVSPALNLNLSSVLFSSVISGTAGETGAEYKLTLLDGDMTIAASGDVTRNGKTVTVPYSISGGSSANATQVSVLVLDKEYTAGNTNGATVLDYQKLNVDSFSTSGTGTYTLPDSLYRKGCGTDYHMYILAEDVNGEKETDYASTPVEITPTWKAPTVKQMNFGTKGIIDPTVPNSASDAWKGNYVYYGNYDADGDGTAEPVKYRVLDASTTDFSADGTTQTMFLDCDRILYYQKFDNDGTANEDGKKANDWSISDVKSSLNGDGFLNKAGVFTTAEKNAIAKSNVASHALTKDSEMGVNVANWTQSVFVNYVALTGEQIFLLDAEDVSNGAYGYSMTDSHCENRKKTGSSDAYWWLRSASPKTSSDNCAGDVCDDGDIADHIVREDNPGVSPALNLNLSSVIFSSANAVSKSSALTSGSTEIGTEANTDWKLTLKDTGKSVKLTEGRSVTKASDGTITVPYTYKDKENATETEKVNQISVMITDKAYDAEKAVNAQKAQILYYGALQDIKNAEGTGSTVAEASTGTGTFALPSSLTGTLGTDYHIYLLAEHVNADNSTDYASEPVEVTAIKTPIDSVTVTGLEIDTPTPEQPLQTEINITTDSTSVSSTAALTWKKEETVATGNAQWKTTYQACVTLTATDGYAFTDTTGAILNEGSVDTENITMNEDGTLTIACGEYTTATRKTESAAAPEVPTQFANYYTADNVLSSTELGKAAKVTLEGTTQPNPEEMEVEWAIVDEEGNATTYDATPTATNTFKWTVKASQYADYNKDDAVLEGTVAIKNKDYTPVTITGEDVTVTYGGTLDVSQYFTIDKNAGTPTYVLLDTSTGAGTLKGATLTMTTLGTFVVKVSTPINGVYNKGGCTITITVNKATPDVESLPTVDDRTYHPSISLVDEDLKGGTVKDVEGKPLAGAWSWKGADVVPTVGNDGYVAVFTPNDKVHYQTIEKTITVNVAKKTPYIKTKPTASAITYGQTLGDSALSGGVVKYSENNETTVAGTFTWKEAATKPTVADSDKTEYDVVFTPTDAEKYNTVETKITLTVNKAASAPNKPNSTMEVDYGKEKVSDITTLPEGWAWQDEDKDKALTVGTAVKATAVYTGADKGNYVTESVEVSITRQACTHTWDGGVVTKEATATQKGEKTYTCTVCKETKKEEIPVKTDHSAPTLGDAQDDKASKQALPVGTKKTSDDRKATYKVTTSDLTKGTVTYVAPTDAKATTVTIPATVVIDGATYKVTAIEKNAFKNNKYIKKVIIGNNIITIGDNAFYGCKKLKTVTIGKSVTKIGSKAFYGCSKIKTLTIKSTKLTTKKIGSKAFTKTPKKMTVKVPKSKLKSYKKLLKAKGVNSRAKIKK